MQDQRHNFTFPMPIRFGIGVVDELAEHLLKNKFNRPLIVSDSIVSNLDCFQEVLRNLESKKLKVSVFTEMQKNPVDSDVFKGKEAFNNNNCDCIIGFGGGVPLDVARAIALSINHKRPLFEYDDLIGGDKYITEEIPYLITIPTTSGTGSEVGSSAIIADDSTRKKRILFSPRLKARQVFADPLLTKDMPPKITAATGMDALTHNMEAYLSKIYHPICEGIALEGMKLIAKSISKATYSSDIQSRKDMLMGSMMGAIAFQKGLGVVHSLAHPLSSLLDTHHGLANAVNLPYGMAFNYNGSEEKFDQMAHALGMDNPDGSKIVDFLFELNKELNIPLKLRDIGVKKEHIERLSELAIEDFCHPNNPKPVSQSDFENLYNQAL